MRVASAGRVVLLVIIGLLCGDTNGRVGDGVGLSSRLRQEYNPTELADPARSPQQVLGPILLQRRGPGDYVPSKHRRFR
jgi:hypothetical protein